jgi:hypothetical protein
MDGKAANSSSLIKMCEQLIRPLNKVNDVKQIVGETSRNAAAQGFVVGLLVKHFG